LHIMEHFDTKTANNNEMSHPFYFYFL
jgi:hypothetical protein